MTTGSEMIGEGPTGANSLTLPVQHGAWVCQTVNHPGGGISRLGRHEYAVTEQPSVWVGSTSRKPLKQVLDDVGAVLAGDDVDRGAHRLLLFEVLQETGVEDLGVA